MIANFANIFLGLALVYAAVLRPSLLETRPLTLFALAAAIFIAAWVARRSDHAPWQNNSNMVLAVFLAGATTLRLAHYPLGSFWSAFSVGTVVAILALWAALYRPTSSATSHPSIGTSAPPTAGPAGD